MSYKKQMPGYTWGKLIHRLHPDGAIHEAGYKGARAAQNTPLEVLQPAGLTLIPL